MNLTTEEVEPGVLRVVGDGVRDLSFRFGFPDAWPGLRTGLDGSVWLRDDELGLIRLGDPRVFEIDYDPFDAYSRGHDSAIALDGTIWTVTHDHALMAFDGEASRRYVAPDGGSFDQVVVTGDGTVWATWVRGKNKAVVGRLAGDAWQIVVAPFRRLPSVQRNVFSVSDDGQIWLGGRRLDEDGPDHGTAIDDAVGANGISPDGTLWARTGATSIARVDASGLTRFDGSDGVPAMNAVGAGRPGEFEVSPDGSLWITAQGGPAQSVLYRFDGSTWTRFRDGSGEIQIAPDGAVWYTGAGPEGLYVIPPTSSGG